MAQGIDVFENPFLGMEGKMKKTLGETDQGHQLIETAERVEGDGEHQMFETFVKEKTTLLSYVQDLIKFAAKLQAIDLSANKIFGDKLQEEETKEAEEIRIKSERDCCIIANRVNSVVSCSSDG